MLFGPRQIGGHISASAVTSNGPESRCRIGWNELVTASMAEKALVAEITKALAAAMDLFPLGNA